MVMNPGPDCKQKVLDFFRSHRMIISRVEGPSRQCNSGLWEKAQPAEALRAGSRRFWAVYDEFHSKVVSAAAEPSKWARNGFSRAVTLHLHSRNRRSWKAITG